MLRRTTATIEPAPSPNMLEQLLRAEQERQQLEQQFHELTQRFEELSAVCERLTAPAHRSAVITRLDLTHSVVEVARGHFRDWVHVHPDVRAEQLEIGAAVRLTEPGNCVLAVLEDPPFWKDVGVFDRWLDPWRMLLEHEGRKVSAISTPELAAAQPRKGDHVGYDDSVGMAYLRIPPAEDTHLFCEDAPDDDFGRLGGLDSQILQIRRAFDGMLDESPSAIRYRHLLGGRTGILLYGPPGNGKTALARCAAAELRRRSPGRRCRFMTITGSEDYIKWIGDSEAKLRARFAAAERAAQDGPVLIFIDEFDAIATTRGRDWGSGAPDRILGTLLGLISGVMSSGAPILIMAATNRVTSLDPAAIRAGRFDEKVHVPAPRRSGAAAILRNYLGRAPLDLHYAARPMDELVQPLLSRVYSPNGPFARLARVRLADGRIVAVPPGELVSGAALEKVVRSAAKRAYARERETRAVGGIVLDDLVAEMDRELRTAAGLLTAQNAHSYLSILGEQDRPVEVLLDRSV